MNRFKTYEINFFTTKVTIKINPNHLDDILDKAEDSISLLEWAQAMKFFNDNRLFALLSIVAKVICLICLEITQDWKRVLTELSYWMPWLAECNAYIQVVDVSPSPQLEIKEITEQEPEQPEIKIKDNRLWFKKFNKMGGNNAN